MQRHGVRAGFTLIEVIVVITILSILAAFAVPRFISQEAEARTAAAQALAGSLGSASALSHALWLAQGQPPTVAMEGATITIVNGYPNRATIGDALGDRSGFSYAPATGVFSKDGTASNCTVTYAEAAGVGRGPAINVVTTGC